MWQSSASFALRLQLNLVTKLAFFLKKKMDGNPTHCSLLVFVPRDLVTCDAWGFEPSKSLDFGEHALDQDINKFVVTKITIDIGSTIICKYGRTC